MGYINYLRNEDIKEIEKLIGMKYDKYYILFHDDEDAKIPERLNERNEDEYDYDKKVFDITRYIFKKSIDGVEGFNNIGSIYTYVDLMERRIYLNDSKDKIKITKFAVLKEPDFELERSYTSMTLKEMTKLSEIFKKYIENIE